MQVKHFFTRTSTRLSLSSNAVPGCCLACFLRSFRTKSFYIDFLGVHTGMGLKAKPTFAAEGKAAQWGSLSWAAGQSRAALHICLSQRLAYCFPTDLESQRRDYWIKAAALSRTTLRSSGTTGAHKDLSVGHLVLAVVTKLSPILKDHPFDPTECY